MGTDDFLARLRAAQSLGDVADLVAELHGRLVAVEAVAHEPQPLVTWAEFEDHTHPYSGLSGYTKKPT